MLEDLHCADPASIKLLDFVVRHSWFERLLVVGLYRDDEVGATGHPMCPLVLPLLAHATCVVLNGLDRDAVGLLMARTANRNPDDEQSLRITAHWRQSVVRGRTAASSTAGPRSPASPR